MASTADEPEQPLDPAGEALCVGPSTTPSTPRAQRPGVSAALFEGGLAASLGDEAAGLMVRRPGGDGRHRISGRR
ncbi:hypothetical protein [Streptomyces aureocirculatus]|uniref:hypothetical protein n=1 Tax=Streptomyces aureocirculatus TaxID=67275 RepID=UPI0012FF25DE|nr:hypothetical protein [Streptomyces aureocirculatus]